MTIYHGSAVLINDFLKPSLSNHEKELVYFSKYINIAAFYIVRNNFYPYRFPNNNKPIRYIEYFNDMFSYFYSGKSGYIYEAELKDGMFNPTEMEGLFASEHQVTVNNRIDIDNVYEYYMCEQRKGSFELVKYCDVQTEEKEKINKNLVNFIVQSKIDETNTGALANTMREKLPHVWEKAQCVMKATAQ